jgi:hypothetical protein
MRAEVGRREPHLRGSASGAAASCVVGPLEAAADRSTSRPLQDRRLDRPLCRSHHPDPQLWRLPRPRLLNLPGNCEPPPGPREPLSANRSSRLTYSCLPPPQVSKKISPRILSWMVALPPGSGVWVGQCRRLRLCERAKQLRRRLLAAHQASRRYWDCPSVPYSMLCCRHCRELVTALAPTLPRTSSRPTSSLFDAILSGSCIEPSRASVSTLGLVFVRRERESKRR